LYTGYPQSIEDITSIFLKHIEGQLPAIPWSEEGLNEETNSIKNELVLLNKKGWWTVASQPAVNGIKSTGKAPSHSFWSYLLTYYRSNIWLGSKEWFCLPESLRRIIHSIQLTKSLTR